MKMLFALLVIAALLFAGCAGAQNPPAQQQGEVAEKTVTPPAPPAGQPNGGNSGGNEVPVGSGPEENVTVPPSPPGSESGESGTPGAVQSANNSTQAPPVPEQQLKEFTIVATLWQFTPSTITVDKGDKVKLTLQNEEGAHGIYISGYDVSVQAGAGETKSVEFTADKEGTFSFRCNIQCGEGHRDMTGTLVVTNPS